MPSFLLELIEQEAAQIMLLRARDCIKQTSKHNGSCTEEHCPQPEVGLIMSCVSHSSISNQFLLQKLHARSSMHMISMMYILGFVLRSWRLNTESGGTYKKSGCSISWSCLYVHPQSERRSLISEEEEEEGDKAILAARPRSKARSHRERKTWIISKENKNVQKNWSKCKRQLQQWVTCEKQRWMQIYFRGEGKRWRSPSLRGSRPSTSESCKMLNSNWKPVVAGVVYSFASSSPSSTWPCSAIPNKLTVNCAQHHTSTSQNFQDTVHKSRKCYAWNFKNSQHFFLWW